MGKQEKCLEQLRKIKNIPIKRRQSLLNLPHALINPKCTLHNIVSIIMRIKRLPRKKIYMMSNEKKEKNCFCEGQKD